MAKWGKLGSRGNVEDRRGMRMKGSTLGIGGFGIVAVIAAGLIGGPETALQVFNGIQQLNQGQVEYVESENAGEFEGLDDYEVFASTVLGSNNDLWNSTFENYREPTLVLFRGATASACGGANSQIGPHYCPRDTTIYLDETFFDELTSRFGARGGDVAEAYVIAHEVGHHVQNLLGLTTQVQRLGTNEASIALELQADCLAGVWAGVVERQGVFEEGEIIEAIDAAESVGDDRIQEKIQGSINPESWTHGSSEDRRKWFTTGYETQNYELCNTLEI